MRSSQCLRRRRVINFLSREVRLFDREPRRAPGGGGGGLPGGGPEGSRGGARRAPGGPPREARICYPGDPCGKEGV